MTMSSGIDPVSLTTGEAAGPFDHARVAAAVRELLIAIGEDPNRDGLVNTPDRVARAYAELTQGMRSNPAEVLGTTFDLGHQELVLVKDIEVHSLCEHHLMPFHGRAHVGYIPGQDGRITGLSKLARLVQVYANRLQVQERMTTQIAEALMTQLNAAGCIVVMECEHMCMAMRGVRKPGALTTTSAVRGVLRDAATRAEAMALIAR
jgi:GTP cyclohydrolase I